jgi:hypothetical protein
MSNADDLVKATQDVRVSHADRNPARHLSTFRAGPVQDCALAFKETRSPGEREVVGHRAPRLLRLRSAASRSLIGLCSTLINHYAAGRFAFDVKPCGAGRRDRSVADLILA